jgi:hypothetical protein
MKLSVVRVVNPVMNNESFKDKDGFVIVLEKDVVKVTTTKGIPVTYVIPLYNVVFYIESDEKVKGK